MAEVLGDGEGEGGRGIASSCRGAAGDGVGLGRSSLERRFASKAARQPKRELRVFLGFAHGEDGDDVGEAKGEGKGALIAGHGGKEAVGGLDARAEYRG